MIRLPISALRVASRWSPHLLCFRARNAARRIALTFDDGPHPEHTPRILDTLDEQGIRVTFFFQGCNARLYPQIVRRAHAVGHQIASHGMQHVSAAARAGIPMLDNAAPCHELLEAIVGTEVPRYFRPPYGDATLDGVRALRDRGFRLVFWSYDSRDSFVTSAEEIVQQLTVDRPADGSILLFHDDYVHTACGLPRVLALLRHQGLSFATVAELCHGPH